MFGTEWVPPVDEWARYRYEDSLTEVNCFRLASLLVEASSGTVRQSNSRPCRSPWEPYCALYRLSRWVDRAYRRIGEYETVWRCVVAADPLTRKRVNAAVSRSAAAHDEIGLLTVVRGERTGSAKARPTERWLYASRPMPLKGTQEQWVRLTGSEAVADFCIHACAIPGVVRYPRFAGAWQSTPYGPHADDSASQADEDWRAVIRLLDTDPDDVRGQVFFLAAWSAMRAGYALPVRYDGTCPSDCPGREWAEFVLDAGAAVTTRRAAVRANPGLSPFRPLSSSLRSRGQNGDRPVASPFDPRVQTQRQGTLDVLPALEASVGVEVSG